MRILSQIRGFSLLELVVVTGLLAALVFGVSQVSGTGARALRRASDRAKLDTSLTLAQNLVRRIGRVASACRVVVVLSVTSLECDVDFGNPPTGVLTKTRFIPSGNSLLYQHNISGRWVNRLTYSGVNGFVVCDSNSMVAGTCPITPRGIANIANTGTNRFFRYQLSGDDSAQNLRSVSYAGAFYMRNPTPFPNVVYQWSMGGRE